VYIKKTVFVSAQFISWQTNKSGEGRGSVTNGAVIVQQIDPNATNPANIPGFPILIRWEGPYSVSINNMGYLNNGTFTRYTCAPKSFFENFGVVLGDNVEFFF
jgi:hypothetical protein